MLCRQVHAYHQVCQAKPLVHFGCFQHFIINLRSLMPMGKELSSETQERDREVFVVSRKKQQRD